MQFRKVTAIIRRDVLEKVETQLQALGVPGISVTKVKGYGEYADFYSRDWLTSHMRIEIFTTEECAEPIANAIMGSAHSGQGGDGIVAILPVEQLYRIRSHAQMPASRA